MIFWRFYSLRIQIRVAEKPRILWIHICNLNLHLSWEWCFKYLTYSGKSVEELEKLQTHIEAKLKDKTEGLDISYWESLISQATDTLVYILLLPGNIRLLKMQYTECKIYIEPETFFLRVEIFFFNLSYY